MRRGSPGNNSSKEEEKYLVNDQISHPEVRLIDLEGNQVGIIKTEDAQRMADDAGVDLVQVAAKADPPVCRLLDYGKLKYKAQKKAAEARKKTATHTVKEIRVRYSTDTHDLDTKVRMARRFLDGGDKVRFLMRFRGREVVYRQMGIDTFDKIAQVLEEVAQIEERTPLVGRKMHMVVAPKAIGKK
jgi:translation initiation factor IF-3